MDLQNVKLIRYSKCHNAGGVSLVDLGFKLAVTVAVVHTYSQTEG